MGLLEANGQAARRGLASGLLDHRGREVDTDDLVPASGKLQGQEARAAADVERIEAGAALEDEIQDAVPGRALAGSPDAVAEVVVEARRPAIQWVATCCLTRSV